MGIFSDKCTNPKCDARVPKSARVCSKCGAPASGVDSNCGRCGSTVATTSKFCWKCGFNLAEGVKTPLFDNRWVRGDDDFAIRVDEADVKGLLTKELIIEDGTKAMLFQSGRFCGYLDAGKYNMAGILKKIITLNMNNPTSVILTDAGDVQLQLEAIKLHSKEQVQVDATFKATVRVANPDKFFINAFKGRNRLTVGYLAGSLMDELRSVLQAYVISKSVPDLYSNTQIRQEVESQMQMGIEPIIHA